jgi:hypothetical protein
LWETPVRPPPKARGKAANCADRRSFTELILTNDRVESMELVERDWLATAHAGISAPLHRRGGGFVLVRHSAATSTWLRCEAHDVLGVEAGRESFSLRRAMNFVSLFRHSAPSGNFFFESLREKTFLIEKVDAHCAFPLHSYQVVAAVIS